MKKKILAAVVAVALAACCVIGGTLAWLTDKTDSKVNTFTVGDVNIDLTETTTTYKILPGTEIAKDPVVTVQHDSEKCYLFVKVDEANWIDELSYAIADGWTELETGVYYQVVDTNKADQTFAVLKDNKVVVSENLTKEEIGAVSANAPTLTFTAYAVQYMKNNTEHFEPAEAWAKIPQK